MSAYIVVFQQIVGSPEAGYGTAYSWDGERFAERKAAISHGLKTRGSDDFNIGVLDDDGRLVSFDWMEEPLEYDLFEIADAIGLTARP